MAVKWKHHFFQFANPRAIAIAAARITNNNSVLDQPSGRAPPDKARNKQRMKCKYILTPIMALTLAVLTTSAFAGRPTPPPASPTPTVAPRLDPPTLTCGTSTKTTITVNVCAGNSGAPAGFSLQWMTLADFVANGNQWPGDSSNLCKASFSGVPGCSDYNLPSLQCHTATVGDIDTGQCGVSVANCGGNTLLCDTDYVFRSFAHNVPGGPNKSDFSATLQCRTASCEVVCVPGCTFTQGYWKTHGPTGCQMGNNCNVWPVQSLTLGTVPYDQAQLCSIFNEPVGGNGLVSLAHQLIAAKLNIASGADSTAIAATIAHADALIGTLMIPPVGLGFLAPSVVAADVANLTAFNEGTLVNGPPHCDQGLPCP